jgi:hypothetical protein
MNIVELARLEAVVGDSVESLSLTLANPRRRAGASREARQIFRRDALVMAGPAESGHASPNVRARIFGSLAVDRTVTWHCVPLVGRGKTAAPDYPFPVKADLFRKLASTL